MNPTELMPSESRTFVNDMRLEAAKIPLRELLNDMRQLAGNSEYLRGYVASLQFTLSLLGITE